MRLAFTSSTDRRHFIPFTSSLRNGWRLSHTVPESIGSFTSLESAPMPLRNHGTSESAAKANWRSGPRSSRHFSSVRPWMFGPDDAFLTTILKFLRQLPVYPMFGRGVTRLQPAYVEDVAEVIVRVMQRAETHATIFELGGPRVYSYEELLRAVARQAGIAPRLIPIPLAVWHALAWASEMFPSPLLRRNQVELMQIDTVSSPEMPGFGGLGISPRSVETILQEMLSNCR
jgi:nucleoside-diphosphate-sugar epimerase